MLICKPPVCTFSNGHRLIRPHLTICICDKISETSRAQLIHIELWHKATSFHTNL